MKTLLLFPVQPPARYPEEMRKVRDSPVIAPSARANPVSSGGWRTMPGTIPASLYYLLKVSFMVFNVFFFYTDPFVMECKNKHISLLLHYIHYPLAQDGRLAPRG